MLNNKSINIVQSWSIDFTAKGTAEFIRLFPKPSYDDTVTIMNNVGGSITVSTKSLWEKIANNRSRVLTNAMRADREELSSSELLKADWEYVDKIPQSQLGIPVVIFTDDDKDYCGTAVGNVTCCNQKAFVEMMARHGHLFTVSLINLLVKGDSDITIGAGTVYVYDVLVNIMRNRPGYISKVIKAAEEEIVADDGSQPRQPFLDINGCRNAANQLFKAIGVERVKVRGEPAQLERLSNSNFNVFVRENLPVLIPALAAFFDPNTIRATFPDTVITIDTPDGHIDSIDPLQLQVTIALIERLLN